MEPIPLDGEGQPGVMWRFHHPLAPGPQEPIARGVPDYQIILSGAPEERDREIRRAAHYFTYDSLEGEIPPIEIYPVLKAAWNEAILSTQFAIVTLFGKFECLPSEDIEFFFSIFEQVRDFQISSRVHEVFRRLDPKAIEGEWLRWIAKAEKDGVKLEPSLLASLAQYIKSEEGVRALLEYFNRVTEKVEYDQIMEILMEMDSAVVESYFLDKLNNGNQGAAYQRVYLDFLSRSKRLETRQKLSEASTLIAQRMIQDPQYCKSFALDQMYWTHGEPRVSAYQEILEPVVDFVLDTNRPLVDRIAVFERCIPEKGLSVLLSDKSRSGMMRYFWPVLYVEGRLEFSTTSWNDLSLSGLYYSQQRWRSLRRSEKGRESEAEVAFYTLYLIPSISSAEASSLAKAYMTAVAQAANLPVELDVNELIKGFELGGKARALARELLKWRLAEGCASEFHQFLENQVSESELHEWYSEIESPSLHILNYLKKRFRGERFLGSGYYYRAIHERWGVKAKELLDSMLDYSEVVQSQWPERSKAVAAIFNTDDNPLAVSELPMEMQTRVIQYFQMMESTLSAPRRKELMSFLPGTRETEDRVGPVLWLLAHRLAELNSAELDELKTKAFQAFDIHIHKVIDESLLLLFRQMRAARPEWTQELDEKIKELQ